MTFGELVRRHRRGSGLTQEDLSERVGLSVTGIRNLESGRTKAPRPSTVRLLADAFGLDGAQRERFFAAAQADDHAAGPAPAWPVPAQLPPDVSGFTGRSAALRRLDELSAGGQAGAVVVVGTAGVGKTALAVHWSHGARDRFPDGQLFADLHGFDAAGATPPEDVARAFLEAFAVPAGRVPADLQARTGLLRSLLAGRRMLVVLDDARDAEQVRPLLPGMPGCFVVVTTRLRLTGLVTDGGARPLVLDVLPRAEATDLLRRRLGAERVAAEPGPVDDLVTRCAGLPLALTVAAARVALQPGLSLAAVRDDVVAARHALDAFGDDDPAADVRGVLSWSYRSLDADAARVFRLLGLHPGPDVAAEAAASLTGLGLGRTRSLLVTLTDAHLLARSATGRFAAHDLLRAYAAELAAAGDDDVRAATGRLLDHYLHTGYAAALLLTPGRERIALPPPDPRAVVTPLRSHDEALAWFTAEEDVLPAVVARAAEAGFEGHAWRLAYASAMYDQRRGRWRVLAENGATALAAARHTGDVHGQVHAHCLLAGGLVWERRFDEAREHATRAAEICAGTEDVTLQAHTALHLSFLFERQGAYSDAVQHAQRAHALFTLARDRHGTAMSLNSIAWGRAQLGELEAAAAAGREAIGHYEELTDVASEANAWDTLGFAEQGLGNHARAAECYQRSYELFTTAGDRYGQAQGLAHLGDVHADSGDAERARAFWEEAVRILDDLGQPEAFGARARLSGRSRSE